MVDPTNRFPASVAAFIAALQDVNKWNGNLGIANTKLQRLLSHPKSDSEAIEAAYGKLHARHDSLTAAIAKAISLIPLVDPKVSPIVGETPAVIAALLKPLLLRMQSQLSVSAGGVPIGECGAGFADAGAEVGRAVETLVGLTFTNVFSQTDASNTDGPIGVAPPTDRQSAIRHMNAAADHLDRFAGLVEPVFHRIEGERRFACSNDDPDMGMDPHQVTRVVWEAIVALDHAVKAMGITDHRGNPPPADRVGIWRDWPEYRAPSAVREAAEGLWLLARGAGVWYASVQRSPSQDAGTRVSIPLNAKAWAIEAASGLRSAGKRIAEGVSAGNDDQEKGELLPAHKPLFSDEFRVCRVKGQEYRFRKAQAACVRAMWVLSEEGKLPVAHASIFEKVGAEEWAKIGTKKLPHVFRTGQSNGKPKCHAAWGTLIKSSGTGYYCLDLT